MARLSRADLLLLLAVGASRHYGWALGSDATAGLASKALGAAAILYLLAVVWEQTRAGAAILLWWAWEELQVLTCTAWYMADPWPVAQGQAICSAKAGFDLGAVGILIIALLAMRHMKTLQVSGNQK